MTAAGRLEHRIRFEREQKTPTGGGASDITWGTVTEVWAGWRPQFGREQVEAGKLESTTRGTITVRTSAAARSVSASDRAVFVAGPNAGPDPWQIRSIVPMRDKIEMTVEKGVAT